MSYSDCEAACFAADECAYFSSGNGFVGSSLPPALSSALAVATARGASDAAAALQRLGDGRGFDAVSRGGEARV